jgi:uncharacterized protein YdeI (YjbR/CyaY-like superfamily)
MQNELKNGIKAFYAKSRKQWRAWLEKNGEKEKSVWLIMHKKESEFPSVLYDEAVEEALCFGWIDSKANKRDAQSYYQFFTKRNPKSKWSIVNKARVDKLIAEGHMHERGLAAIELAKQNGTWAALDKVGQLTIPEDLQKALAQNEDAIKFFDAFSISAKRSLLEWIASAKREETRRRRIAVTVASAAKNIRANQYRQSP